MDVGKRSENKKSLREVLKKLKERVLTRKNQIILYVITLLSAMLCWGDILLGLFPEWLTIVLCCVSGVSFFLSLALWIRTLKLLISLILMPFIMANELIMSIIRDKRLKAVIMAIPGLGINLIFAVFNAVLGITSRSAWHGALAAYYAILCAMRFISVMYAKSIYIDRRDTAEEERELKVYRTCGILLSVMSIALAAAVLVLLNGIGGKTYPGLMIYAVAAYTFYKFTSSILNLIKSRGRGSALVKTLSCIGYSDALVSLLYLQTALLTEFGGADEEFGMVVNLALGTVVVLTALGIGLSMVVDAERKMRRG